MRFLYVLLFVSFTTAVPFPSIHLAITGLNARDTVDGPRDTLGGPHVPSVMFSKKFWAIPPETKQTHMTYAQNFHAALDNSHPLKGAPYVIWESPSRFQYHSGLPNEHNKIGEAQFKPPTVGYSKTLPKSNIGGIEAKIHSQYTILPVDNQYKIATNAHVFKGWHQKDRFDVAAGRERAVFQYYRGGPPGRGEKIGEPWNVFRDASERSRPPASGPQPQRAQL